MSSDRGSTSSGPSDSRQADLTQGLVGQVQARLRQLADDLTGAAPLDVLASVHALQQVLGPVQADAVRQALAEGAAWSDVGSAAGIRRQSAHDRWGHLDPRRQQRAATAPATPADAKGRGPRRELVTLRLPALPMLPAVNLEVQRRVVP